MNTLLQLLILAAVVFGIAKLLPGIRCKGFVTALVVAVVMSVTKWVIYKVLFLITVPFIILTGGLGFFAIAALVLWVTDKLIDDFEIKNFGTTVVAALLIAICNGILSWILV